MGRTWVAPGHDRRRYNLPTADEVAVILPGMEGDSMQLSQRDIVLQNRAGGLQIINDLHPAYVPLYYVLLFPYSKNGWHPALSLHLRSVSPRPNMSRIDCMFGKMNIQHCCVVAVSCNTLWLICSRPSIRADFFGFG